MTSSIRSGREARSATGVEMTLYLMENRNEFDCRIYESPGSDLIVLGLGGPDLVFNYHFAFCHFDYRVHCSSRSGGGLVSLLLLVQCILPPLIPHLIPDS